MPIEVVCLSHTPLLRYFDPEETVKEAAWDGYHRLRDRIAEFDPELVIIFTPDHYNGFFYDCMPPFCLGFQATSIEDYETMGGSLTIPGDIAERLRSAVVDADIDLAVSHKMTIDHGCAQPLEIMFGALDRVPTIPIFINCAAAPFPPLRRVRRLGEAVGRFAAAQDRRVLIMGTGGLSHDPPIPTIETADDNVRHFLIGGKLDAQARERRRERVLQAASDFNAGKGPCRPLNADWDREILDLVCSGDLAPADRYRDDWIDFNGGCGGHEIRTWIAACAALASQGAYEPSVLHYEAIPAWMAGFGLFHARSKAA